ncbi:MAG: ATP-binding protein [Longimicrobiales bacterium]
MTHARDHEGLGLISIKERVRLLNGHVEVESQKGRGTTLQIYIPLTDRGAVASRPPGSRAPARASARSAADP